MVEGKPRTGAMGNNPLEEIPEDVMARLSPKQREILTLRFTTLEPRHVIAEKVGVSNAAVIAQENRALRLLSLPSVKESKESKDNEADTPAFNISGLSPDCQDLHANIGTESLLKLIDEFGGSRIHIPMNITDGHKLARVLGIESSRKLSAYFGGEALYIPIRIRSKQKQSIRNEQMWKRYTDGQKVISIATEAGLGERQTAYILAKMKSKRMRLAKATG